MCCFSNMAGRTMRVRLRLLPNPANAEIFQTTSDEAEISACIVNAGCKIGYIR